MADKTTEWKPEPVAWFTGGDEVRPATPSDLKLLRRPWGEHEVIRAVIGPEIPPGSSTEIVWLEHRRHKDLMFRIEMDRLGEVVSFTVRPLAFNVRIGPDDGAGRWHFLEVDENAIPEGSPRLSAGLLRDLPLGQLKDAAVASFGHLHRIVGIEPPPTSTKKHSSSLSDLDLALLAADYVHLLQSGSPKPMRALSKQWNLSYDGAVHRKRAAVTRGLLTKPSSQGRSDGVLTDKALKLLENQSIPEED